MDESWSRIAPLLSFTCPALRHSSSFLLKVEFFSPGRATMIHLVMRTETRSACFPHSGLQGTASRPFSEEYARGTLISPFLPLCSLQSLLALMASHQACCHFQEHVGFTKASKANKDDSWTKRVFEIRIWDTLWSPPLLQNEKRGTVPHLADSVC